MPPHATFGTWNMYQGGVDRDGDEWRRHSQITRLTKINTEVAGLDVLALQEATHWHKDAWRRLWELAEALHMQPLEPITSRVGDGVNHTILLYRPDTVEVIHHRHRGRQALYHGLGKADLRIQDVEVTALYTHLSWTSGDERLAEVRWLADHADPSHRAVLMGDLNVLAEYDPEPDDWSLVPRHMHSRYRLVRSDGSFGPVDRRALRLLLNSGWRDPQDSVPERRAATVGHFYADEPVPWHLDHILVTQGIAPTAYVTHGLDRPYASDHLPVTLTATLT